MNVVGVIDLLDGRAVHACGGIRAQYQPIRSVAGVAIDAGDARAVARVYQELGVREIYVADLSAILQRSHQDHLTGSLAGALPVWLDAGVTSAPRAEEIAALGVAHVVIGLETLSSFDALAGISAAVGSEVTTFSLDLRDGVPLMQQEIDLRGCPPEDVAAHAADAGAGAVIVLDLARVGRGTGLDLLMLERIRRRVPHVTLMAGGGVRGPEDLTRLGDAGCDGALVATALLSGQITLR